MTKEELSKYLSGISGIKETVLDNFKYKDDFSKITEYDLKKYTDMVETIKPYTENTLNKMMEELHNSMLPKASESYLTKLQEDMAKIMQPTLPDELTTLNSIYNNQFEKWQEGLEKLNILTKINEASSISSFDALREYANNISKGTLSNQYPLAIDALMYGSNLPLNTQNTNHSKEESQMSNIKINKIQLSNFRFFTDDGNNNTFEPNGSNMLIYGENGSGKSSLFKAFEFLSNNKLTAKELIENKNSFNNNSDIFIQFEFDNNKSDRRIDEDYKVDENDLFIQNLSIFKPILNYQKLLQVSYSENSIDNEKNLYSFFKTILEEYPIENSKVLKDLQGESYFNKFKEIILSDLLEEINLLLKKFDDSFKITNIRFDGYERTVFLDIEYYDKSVNKYHLFLNEARLSALAMSVYFSIIKKQFSFLTHESLKILVLDDILISLDMNNRLNLIDILKEEFSDSQIFFFTHDKGLFEVFKDKMNWKSYEIYVDKHDDGYEIPYIKKHESYSELANNHFKDRDYPACANYLRKEVERLFVKKLDIGKLERLIELAKKEDNYKKLEECFPRLIGALKSFENCKHITDPHKREEKCLEFANVISKAVESVQEIISENSFHDINGIKDRILNPQSHDDTTTVLYKRELSEAIKLVEELSKEFSEENN